MFGCNKNNHLNTILGRTLLCIVFFSQIILFSSCDNFLNAKEVKEEIEEVLDYNRAKTVPISLSCPREMGTIFPESSYLAKLGYEFELQFVLNADNYFISDKTKILEAVSRVKNESRADCVVFSAVTQSAEDKNIGLYRIKAKVVKDADDIMIRPVPSLRPKVTDIYPPNNPEGVAQDSTIRITFNKPVNPLSFGFFSCITIRGSSNPDIASCYGKPYFSNNNTILNIPVDSGKSIIEDDADNTYEDVTLNIDFSNITDEEGIPLVQNNSYTFRVNKNVDTLKPVLTSLVLKTTEDTSASYYRTLTAKPFNTWTKSGTQDNPYGDYSTNHVGKNIYIEVTGYDKDSGVNGIQIVETLYKLIEGGDPAGTLVKTGYSGINKFEYVETDSDNNNIYSLNDTYTFTSFNDGVFKLDISVLDNAGNASTPVTYYVIKDTIIDSNSIQFLETKDYSRYNPSSEYGEYVDIFSRVRVMDNGSDTVVLTLDSSSVDTFFEGCTSEYEIEVLYGDSESTINNRASRNGNVFSYTRKSDQLSFVKLICSDEVGNKVEFLRALPPKPVIENVDKGYYYPDDESGYTYEYPVITYKNADMYNNLCETCGADSFGIFYVVRNKTIEYANYGSSPGIKRMIIKAFSYDYTDSVHDFYIVQYYRYGETYWYSVLSSEYVIANVRCYEPYGSVELIDDLTLKGETSNSSQTYTQSFDPYMKDYLKVTAQPCYNSGCYKIKLDDYKKHGVDTSNVIYSFECVNRSTNEIYSFSEPEFYLPTKATYKVFVYAKEKNGSGYYKSLYCWCYVNGANSIYNRDYSFGFSKDLTAPCFDDTPHSYTWDTAAYFLEPALPYDNPAGVTGMYEDPAHPGYGKIDYYFIPNTNTDIEAYSKYTLQDLEAFEKHTLLYNFTDTSIKIPYGQLDEGLYTLCMVAYDKNGNYAIKCAPALNITKKTKVNPDFTYTGSNTNGLYKFTSTVTDFCLDYYNDNVSSQGWQNIRTFEMPQTPYFEELSTSWYFQFDGKYDPSYDGWVKIYGPKINFEVDDGSHVIFTNTIYNSGFYYVDYKYIPYEKSKVNPNIAVLKCNNKNIIPGVIGLQVICDQSVFAHTVYSPKKLTETTEAADIAIWETKGFETGIVVNNETFTYTEDNYSEVPEGWYYTTIIHFADGTAYMTEVKKKK